MSDAIFVNGAQTDWKLTEQICRGLRDGGLESVKLEPSLLSEKSWDDLVEDALSRAGVVIHLEPVTRASRDRHLWMRCVEKALDREATNGKPRNLFAGQRRGAANRRGKDPALWIDCDLLNVGEAVPKLLAGALQIIAVPPAANFVHSDERSPDIANPRIRRVLAIDGGGIRGLIPATVCERIEDIAKVPIHQLFDLIAGTSTGGIIAMALAIPPGGTRATELVDLYSNKGGQIFSGKRLLGPMTGPRYRSSGLSELIKNQFNNLRVSEALTNILVPTYDIVERIHYNISRRVARLSAKDDHLMRDVAMGTSAAPTYFEPFKLGERVLIDGGIVANNPACLAVMEARYLWPHDEILLVSIGTGTLARPIDYETARDWGALGWASPLIECIFDGATKVTEEIIGSGAMKNVRAVRFQYGLNDMAVRLDDVSKDAINSLKQIGKAILRDRNAELKSLAKELISIGAVK